MKKDIFLSTKKNIIAISTSVVFVCLIVFAVIIQALYSSRLLDNIDHQLLEQKRFFSTSPFNINDDRYWQNTIKAQNDEHPEEFKGKLEDKPMHIPPNLIVVVYKNETFQLISKNAYFSEDSLPILPAESSEYMVNFEQNGYSFRGITINQGDYKVQVFSNIDPEVNSINRLRTSIIGSLIILIIIALILSAYLASKVIKPVREAYEKQVYFVQDASHEMRTPLAVIKGKLELLAHSWGDKIDDHFEHISKMMSEIRGLEKLNSDLLLLSKEDLDLAVNITNFSLDDFVNDISEFYMDLAEIKEKTFTVTKPKDEINVEWDYTKLKRSIIILIENAFKYTNEHGEINLIVEDLGKFVQIKVKDNGIGIKEEDQKRIFDRFYRSELVRGQNISGTGIGLSLLKSISKNFGIKLKVNSEYGVGSEFILTIPKVIK